MLKIFRIQLAPMLQTIICPAIFTDPTTQRLRGKVFPYIPKKWTEKTLGRIQLFLRLCNQLHGFLLIIGHRLRYCATCLASFSAILQRKHSSLLLAMKNFYYWFFSHALLLWLTGSRCDRFFPAASWWVFRGSPIDSWKYFNFRVNAMLCDTFKNGSTSYHWYDVSTI